MMRPSTRASGGRSSGSVSSSSGGELVSQVLRHELHQHLADQARLSGPGDAGDRREHAQREIDVEPVEDCCASRRCRRSQPCGARAVRAWRRVAARTDSGGSARLRRPARPAGGTAVEDLAAVLAGRRARHRRSSRRAASRRDRARPRTANCRRPSARRAPRAAPRCRPDAGPPRARRARRRRRTGWSESGSPAAAAAVRRARAWACCDRASDSRARGRAGPRAAPVVLRRCAARRALLGMFAGALSGTRWRQVR